MTQNNVNVPGSWRGVRNKLEEAPENVQRYFKPVEKLIEHFPWEVSLSYMYALVERAHLNSIYCGVVKLHQADATLARKAVDKFENRRKEFQQMFARVFGRAIPAPLQALLKVAQDVRDRALHGKRVPDRDYRMAIAAVIDYAVGFNEECERHGSFQPFGGLRGFKGRKKLLDRKTSRWVLKGIGLPLK